MILCCLYLCGLDAFSGSGIVMQQVYVCRLNECVVVLCFVIEC